jgi:hypothetical protein
MHVVIVVISFFATTFTKGIPYSTIQRWYTVDDSFVGKNL